MCGIFGFAGFERPELLRRMADSIRHRGPDGEVWDLFTSLPPLMKDCAALLAPGAAMVLTVYAIRASSQSLRQCVKARDWWNSRSALPIDISMSPLPNSTR